MSEEKRRKAQIAFRKNVGKRIRKAREATKLTKEQVAAKCKMSATQLGHYEAGRRLPSAITLFKVCKGLGISADELLAISKSS